MFKNYIVYLTAGVNRPTAPPPSVDYNLTRGIDVDEVTYPGLILGGCAGTRFGCCLDGKRAAEGPNSQGCPEGTFCVLSYNYSYKSCKC